MASNVVVQVDHLRKVTVKTTPAMTLKMILDQACQKYELDPEQHGLKLRRDMLDLSLSIRLANLAPGSKLELVKVANSGGVSGQNAQVQIALQLDEGGRSIETFHPSATLWDILMRFETKSNGVLNLTKRTGVPSKDASKKFSLKQFVKSMTKPNSASVYMQPVLLLLNREFNNVPQLTATRLKDLGLTKGNAVIRLIFKETDVALDDVLPLMTVSSETGGETLSAPIAVAKEPAKPQPEAHPKQEIHEPATAPSEMQKPQQPDPAPANAPAPMEVDATSKEPGTFDRQVKVFRSNQANVSAAQIQLPDSFFQLTSAEMKFMMDSMSARRRADEDRPLMTKAMRDKQEAEKARKYPKTMIRIRFPNYVVLQGVFLTSSETVSDIYDFVRQHLADPTLPFYLYVTPPMKRLADAETLGMDLYKAGLAPASVVNFGVDGNFDKGHEFLSSNAVSLIEEEPIHPTLSTWVPEVEQSAESLQPEPMERETNESPNTEKPAVASDQKDSSSTERKVPRWFKMPLPKK